MTAVFRYTYGIDPSLNISNLTAEEVWGILVESWGTEIEAQRQEKRNLLIDNGISAGNSNTILNRALRTLSSGREFVDPNNPQAQEYKTWHETAIPSVIGPFTSTSSVITDDQNLHGAPYFETI